MEITNTTYKRADVIAISGRVDSDDARALDAAIAELTDNGRHNLVFDLSAVDYISSSGIRALVLARKKCQEKNGAVSIATPSARAREVLDLAGMSHLFEIYDELIAAVGSV